jgi:Protein of unknown function (DUF3102)
MSDAISNANPEKVDRRVLAAALKAADGNLKKVSVPRAAVTPRSIDEWARIITGDLTRAVEGIIAAGRHLQEAKAEVDHGDWLPLLERLKIGERTAQMLMKVAANEALADPNHWFVADALRACQAAALYPRSANKRWDGHPYVHARGRDSAQETNRTRGAEAAAGCAGQRRRLAGALGGHAGVLNDRGHGALQEDQRAVR